MTLRGERRSWRISVLRSRAGEAEASGAAAPPRAAASAEAVVAAGTIRGPVVAAGGKGGSALAVPRAAGTDASAGRDATALGGAALSVLAGVASVMVVGGASG